MSLNTFNHTPPNLCCKHVLTDSLKELIAPNNLTIWLGRSIPARLLALQRLGSIQTLAMLLWCEKGEKDRARERERWWGLPGHWKDEGMTKTTICSLYFLPAAPVTSKGCITMIQLQTAGRRRKRLSKTESKQEKHVESRTCSPLS